MSQLNEIIQNKKNDPSCLFMLSSMHASKGLEYDDVYITDAYDGMLPNDPADAFRDKNSEAFRQYEEERRLFYVAVTRAKNRVFLLNDKACRSSFGDELLGKRKLPEHKMAVSSSAGDDKYGSFDSFCDRYKAGAEIVHKRFGSGKVLSQDNDIITAEFEGAGSKKLLLSVLYNKKLVIL